MKTFTILELLSINECTLGDKLCTAVHLGALSKLQVVEIFYKYLVYRAENTEHQIVIRALDALESFIRTPDEWKLRHTYIFADEFARTRDLMDKEERQDFRSASEKSNPLSSYELFGLCAGVLYLPNWALWNSTPEDTFRAKDVCGESYDAAEQSWYELSYEEFNHCLPDVRSLVLTSVEEILTRDEGK